MSTENEARHDDLAKLPRADSRVPSSIDAAQFDGAFKSIGERLAVHRQLDGFSTRAETRLIAAAVDYFDSLGRAAVIAASRRAGASVVDEGDVDWAQSEMSAARAQLFGVLLAIACATGGGFLATLVAVLIAPPDKYLGAWIAGLAVLGVSTVIFGAAAYRKRKS